MNLFYFTKTVGVIVNVIGCYQLNVHITPILSVECRSHTHPPKKFSRNSPEFDAILRARV